MPDDCQIRSIAIDDVTLEEGTGGTTDLVFTVTLTGDLDHGFTVPLETASVRRHGGRPGGHPQKRAGPSPAGPAMPTARTAR